MDSVRAFGQWVCALSIYGFVRLIDVERWSTSTHVAYWSMVALALYLGISEASFDGSSVWAQLMMFVFALSMNASFIFVSRMRNRHSYTFLAGASFLSNATWYVLMNHFYQEQGDLLLVVPFVLGMLMGRVLVGDLVFRFIEQRFDLKANESLLSEAARAHLAQDRAFGSRIGAAAVGLCLTGALVVSGATSDPVLFWWTCLVALLGVVQNFIYTIASRLSNRNHGTMLVLGAVLSSGAFLLSFYVLIVQELSWAYFLVYVVATTVGTLYGKTISVWLEQRLDIKTDTKRTDGHDLSTTRVWVWALGAGAVWLAGVELLRTLDLIRVSPVVLPGFPVGLGDAEVVRVLLVLLIAATYFMQNVTFSVMRRAGNRNHVGYHSATIAVNGVFSAVLSAFWLVNLTELVRIIDLVPILLIAVALGELFGARISSAIEKRLVAVMDVPPEPKELKKA